MKTLQFCNHFATMLETGRQKKYTQCQNADKKNHFDLLISHKNLESRVSSLCQQQKRCSHLHSDVRLKKYYRLVCSWASLRKLKFNFQISSKLSVSEYFHYILKKNPLQKLHLPLPSVSLLNDAE